MTTRMLAGYGLVAAILFAGFVALWFGVLRERWAWRRRRRNARRDRLDAAPPPSTGARPAYEAD